MTGTGSEGPGASRRSSTHDWLIPVAIVILGLALRLRYFNYFLVPDSDFFSLRATAVALMHGEPPPDFQRLPFYSLLMGALALLFRGRDPVLVAAETVNLAAFAVATFFLYRLSARFLGAGAWIVAFLFTMDGLGFHMTAQPRTELPTVALVILGCYLAVQRPAAAYVPAALAALTRYEGAFLIPALLTRDLAFGPRRWRACILAGAASFGLVVWLWLNLRATGHLNPYFSYVGGATTAAGVAFLSVLVRACLASVGLTVGGTAETILGSVLGALILGGLVRMFRLSPREALPIVAFFVMTLALNMAFFSPTPEHAFMIVWICELAVVVGLAGLAGAARQWMRVPSSAGPYRPGMQVLLGTGALLGIAALVWPAYHHGAGLPKAALAASAVAIGAILATARPPSIPTAALLAVAIAVMPLGVRHDLLAVSNRLDAVTYVKGEMRLAGEWLAAHARPSERMAVTEPWVVAAYAGPISEQTLVGTQTLTAAGPRDLAPELRRLGIDYVLWDSHQGALPPTNFYFRKYRIDLLSQLGEGRSSPDFELLDTLRAGPSYAYVYRVRP
ncbi:MAG TPA: hypothetical protein VEU27_15665 [Gemmatimonadales bacterium]|nr:hypothetical protein [Gemmatimonadales bacterium]